MVMCPGMATDDTRRISLIVDKTLSAKIDRAIALHTLKTGKRQSLTAFIVAAIEHEIAQIESEPTEKPATH